MSYPGLVSDQACWSPMMLFGHRWVSDQACQSTMGLQTGILVSDGTCQSRMCLRSCMLVSGGSPMKHVSLRQVFNETCCYSIRHVGLRWISDKACLSPMGLQRVSDMSPIIIIFSWTPYFPLFFFCRFLILSKFSIFFQRWESLQTRQNIMHITYVYTVLRV